MRITFTNSRLLHGFGFDFDLGLSLGIGLIGLVDLLGSHKLTMNLAWNGPDHRYNEAIWDSYTAGDFI